MRLEDEGSIRRVLLVLSREEEEDSELIVVDDRREEVAMVEDRLVGWSAGHCEEMEVCLAHDGDVH